MLDQKVTQFLQKLPKKKSKQFLFKICDIFHDNDQSPEVFGYFWKKIYHPDILKLAKSEHTGTRQRWTSISTQTGSF